MKLAVLGGGGVRSPFLARALVHGAKKVGITEIIFMDSDHEKLSIFGEIAKKVSQAIDPNFPFYLTEDIEEAVAGAHYIITTLRVGGDQGRIHDERIALDLNILGQETTGAGGFSMALRTVPALLHYCEMIKKLAHPNAFIFNFTNPSGIVTQVLRDAGFDNVYGICDAPTSFADHLKKALGVESEKFSMRAYGLNHLSWFDQVMIDGEEKTKEIATSELVRGKTHMGLFDRELVELNGNVLLNEYLYFYYYREKAVSSILASEKTRGETIADINQRMIKELKSIDLKTNFDKAFNCFYKYYLERENSYMSIEANHQHEQHHIPTLEEFICEEEAGGYAGVALDFIRGLHAKKTFKMVLAVPNQGAIDGFLPTDVVEVSCFIDALGATPMKIGKIPEMHMTLMQTMKFYERKVSQAILKKDKKLAIEGLMHHPLVNSYSLAKSLVDNYLKVHAQWVGEWQ